jgi:hypothetical protein
MGATRISLSPAMFEDKERLLVEHGQLTASTFRFESGVAALRLRNGLGELVLLPFQGQQIWSASMGGRTLTMKSMFEQPRPTQVYLDTYGAFLIHCGMTAMGVPAAGDTHPLHGELPNARYQQAWLLAIDDESGSSLALQGQYQHTVAFSHNYRAEPTVRLYAGSTLFSMRMEVTNLRRVPMERMYMAHVNFRPVDNGRLVYSAPSTARAVRVRKSIPSHIKPGPGYKEFIDELAVNPKRHEVLAPGLAFDPEIVFFVDYQADAGGWAHSMQVHPDGSADYIAHRPSQLDKGVRWISRTPDQDCLGIVLPSTAEPEGYTAEKAKGNVKLLGPGESWACDMWAGALDATGAATMEERIRELVGQERSVPAPTPTPAPPAPAPERTPEPPAEPAPMVISTVRDEPVVADSPVLVEIPATPEALTTDDAAFQLESTAVPDVERVVGIESAQVAMAVAEPEVQPAALFEAPPHAEPPAQGAQWALHEGYAQAEAEGFLPAEAAMQESTAMEMLLPAVDDLAAVEPLPFTPEPPAAPEFPDVPEPDVAPEPAASLEPAAAAESSATPEVAAPAPPPEPPPPSAPAASPPPILGAPPGSKPPPDAPFIPRYRDA